MTLIERFGFIRDCFVRKSRQLSSRLCFDCLKDLVLNDHEQYGEQINDIFIQAYKITFDNIPFAKYRPNYSEIIVWLNCAERLTKIWCYS